jgi:hypothetical protein
MPDRPRREQAAPAMATAHIFPEQHNLSVIARKVSASHRAYPLADIAYLFLDNADACLVRIEPLQVARQTPLNQCRLCHVVALTPASLLSHLVRCHMEEHFTVEETVGEAPTGQFVCVARCGMSETLLGPPNHHTYQEKIQELHRTRFAHMSFEAYQGRIEMLRDPEKIEQWKEESRRQTRYRLKDAPEGSEPLTRAAAENLFREQIAPTLMERTHRAVMTLKVAQTLEDVPLRDAVRDAFQQESRFPLSIMFALRAAFRHMHLHVFKAGGGKGVNFVTARKPTPLDPEHVVAPIREVLLHLRAHPGCTRPQLLEALRPGEALDSPACRELLSHLGWLTEKGHVIEFNTGTLAVPLQSSARSSGAEEPAEAPAPAATAQNSTVTESRVSTLTPGAAA